jgi:DNA (cytosine-5)-methyltransferase 1
VPDVVDLYGGPGGWAEGLRSLGLTDFGIDRDQACYTTRRAAGHDAILGDVSELDPTRYSASGLIGSPPCPLFSDAGLRHGVAATDLLAGAIGDVARGRDPRAQLRQQVADLVEPAISAAHPEWDAGTLLLDVTTRTRAEAERLAAEAAQVLEPARWAHSLHPEWIALEQVRAVLPIWQAYAAALGELGYDTATGIVDVADYGVPQHRRRAVLVASRVRPARLPIPTHGPGRIPWVSMATALGWKAGRVGFPRRDDGSGTATDDGYRDRDWWPVDGPAPTLTEKARSWSVVLSSGPDAGMSRPLELAEALILQGFRADYPLHGTRTDRFRQVGDAVPPPLAAALVGVVT